MKADLDIGGTLRQVFEIYREQARVLLPVAFWLFLIAAIVTGLTEGDLALAPIQLVVTTIVTTLYMGMVVGLVRDVQEGRRDFSVGELSRSVLPVLLPLIAASVLFFIGIFFGFILLVVPGLILVTIWAVFAPVIVIERSGVFDAFGRSRELVRGNGWRVFGVVIITGVIVVVVAIALAAIAMAIANGPIVSIVISALASTVTAPVEGLVASVLYFRLLAIERSAPSPQPEVASVLEQPGDGQG
ncbi:MAG: hypothetical protein WBL45_03375 [Solirubrobacterales bacterium]